MHRLIYLALVVYGAFAQITQALLIREDLVVFYGNEVSLGAFFGSWLLWVAVGSALAISLKHRIADPLPWVRDRKFWPSVARVDNAFGDRHLVARLPAQST